MGGGVGEANGERFYAGAQCGAVGFLHTAGVMEGARQIHQNSSAKAGGEGRLQGFTIGSGPCSVRLAPVFLDLWSLVGWS